MTARAPMPPHRRPRGLRLVDPLAGLTFVADLGMGHEPEQALRTCMAATILARRIGLEEGQVRDVFYTALLQHIGCSGYAHETAAILGDDIALNRAGTHTNFNRPREVLTGFLPAITAGRGPLARVQVGARLLTAGDRYARENNRVTPVGA